MTRWMRSAAECVLGKLTAATAALLVACAGCRQPASQSPELPTPKVTVAAAIAQETIDYDEFVGRTEASETVEVRSRVYGYLQDVKFQDGDDVEVGKTLFLIEPDEYNAILQQAKAKVAVGKSKSGTAKAKHARNEKLIKSGAVSREEYDETAAAIVEADAIITAAEADEARAKLDVDYTQIQCPIGGRIDRTYVTRGNFVTGGATGGTLLTRIVQNRPIYVYFDADELALLKYMRLRKPESGADVSKLRDRNIPCLVQLADETGFPHQGVLDFAENRVDASTGTLRLRGVLDNDDRQFTGGMFVRVRVPVSDSYQAVMIPEQAIATDQGQKFVYVVDDENKAVRRNVTLGAQQDSLRIVREGLQSGERVIVSGQQRVRTEQNVDPQTAPATKAAAHSPRRPLLDESSVAADSTPPAVAESPVVVEPVVEPVANSKPAENHPASEVAPPAASNQPIEVNKPAIPDTKRRRREF